MSIDKLLSEYKTEAELKAFAEAQHKALIQVQKKNKQLEEENLHLQKLVEGVVPIIQTESNSILSVGKDEEEIAKIELRKLKKESMGNESLTLEQAKKVEIYSKILNAQPKEKSRSEREVQELDRDSLLAIVESNNGNKVN